MTLMFIPSTIDMEENTVHQKESKEYEELLKAKIGSDSYNERAA